MPGRFVYKVVKTALAIVTVALAAACGGAREGAGATASDVPAATSQEPAETPTPEVRCEFPPSQPTYLPWDGDGEIEEPLKEEFAGYSKFVWSADGDGRWQDAYVQFWVTTSEGRVEGRPTGVVQWGREGVLSVGANKVGIFWQPLGNGRDCDTGALVLKAPPLALDEASDQLLRIARSMPRS